MELKYLVKKAKKGDKEALLKLILQERDNYYRLAYVYMKNQQDAEDMVQEMILSLYDSINSLRKEESFYSWSKTILVNQCKGSLAGKTRVIPVEAIREEAVAFNGEEDRMDLDHYLETLKANHREIIRLRYYLDMDYKSISEVLEIPLGTVKSRINTAMEKLRSAMGEENLDEQAR
ncbi:MAG: RNA polymerase sigma factor [Gudongella sp.]|nr:RNA polymerase sigma factor [Gudongella sp.]